MRPLRRSDTLLLTLVLLAACDFVVAPDRTLPDGNYELSIASAFTGGFGPGFSVAAPVISFRKSGNTFAITGTAFRSAHVSGISISGIRSAKEHSDSWEVQFDVRPGPHTYYTARFNSEECFDAAAVEAQYNPDKVYRSSCTIRKK